MGRFVLLVDTQLIMTSYVLRQISHSVRLNYAFIWFPWSNISSRAVIPKQLVLLVILLVVISLLMGTKINDNRCYEDSLRNNYAVFNITCSGSFRFVMAQCTIWIHMFQRHSTKNTSLNKTWILFCFKGWGVSNVSGGSLVGENFQFDEHIVRMGWNHQRDMIESIWILQ